MLYHVSPHSGLRSLQPRQSTHGKAYVYAVEDPVIGLLFGAKKDDFDFMLYTDDTGVPVLCECYPDALRSVYGGKSCSVYAVEEKGFLRGKTPWQAELVCESEVKVVEEQAVADLYLRLLEEEGKQRLRIHRYARCDGYRKKIADHIVDRIIRFGIDLNSITETDSRFSGYYRAIVQELKSITDGHLLP